MQKISIVQVVSQIVVVLSGLLDDNKSKRLLSGLLSGLLSTLLSTLPSILLSGLLSGLLCSELGLLRLSFGDFHGLSVGGFPHSST